MRIAVRVKPRARADCAGGSWGREGRLLVTVRAPAVDGRANAATARVVAEAFDVAPRSVKVVAGSRSRSKVLELGDPPADAEDRLACLLTGREGT